MAMENKAEKTVVISDSLPMNGGDGTHSYSKNSSYQRLAASFVEEKINQEIAKNLDVKCLSLPSNQVRLADLGCATGPNTFIAMENVVKAMEQKYHSQSCPNPDSKPLEFHVFFSDRTANDFNTLFKSIPENRKYFAAGVPGSFYGRLFPESSLHFVYTSHALHWLSKLPEELLDKDSPAWNKGRIYYLNSPREVYNAYRSRFYCDVDNFLNARAKEIVQGGMMVITVGGCPDGMDSYSNVSYFGLIIDLMGSALMDMAKEGLISESLVDSFNIPIYFASPEEIIGLVERNGHFTTEKIDFMKSILQGSIEEISTGMKHYRAGLEGMLSKHFGNSHIDEMFVRFEEKHRDHAQLLASTIKDYGQLFIVLKRK